MNEDGEKLPGGFVSAVTHFRAKNAAKISHRTNPMEYAEKERRKTCASELTKKARRDLQPPVFEAFPGAKKRPVAQPHPGIGQVD